VALAYLATGLAILWRNHAYRAALLADLPGLLLPLRLFILASAPAGAAYALLWAERGLSDPRLRRAARAVTVLVAGLVVITLAGGLPT
jgi:cytochrome bd-type quinol oxidase subunit 2